MYHIIYRMNKITYALRANKCTYDRDLYVIWYISMEAYVTNTNNNRLVIIRSFIVAILSAHCIYQ